MTVNFNCYGHMVWHASALIEVDGNISGPSRPSNVTLRDSFWWGVEIDKCKRYTNNIKTPEELKVAGYLDFEVIINPYRKTIHLLGYATHGVLKQLLLSELACAIDGRYNHHHLQV